VQSRGMVPSRAYYNEYHGHKVEHLREVHGELRKGPDSVDPVSGGGGRRPLVWLAGDSSLDNKFWIPGSDAVMADA
jgi:hypothetical protein